MSNASLALELLASMPARDFLNVVVGQKKKNIILNDRVVDLSERLSDAVDLVCVFQKKAETLSQEKKGLIKRNFKLNDKIRELQQETESETESEDSSDTEDTVEQHEVNNRFENIKKLLEEKLEKIRKMAVELCRLKLRIKELQIENENLRKKTPFVFKAPPLLNYVPNKNEKWPTGPP